jgi:outer membrane murein-binding lipoprotein Lpp
MVRKIRPLLVAALFCGGLALWGCSSAPSDDELRQLSELKKQADQLDSEVKTKKADVAALSKRIADRNAALQQCQSDQEAVKKAMGGK